MFTKSESDLRFPVNFNSTFWFFHSKHEVEIADKMYKRQTNYHLLHALKLIHVGLGHCRYSTP